MAEGGDGRGETVNGSERQGFTIKIPTGMGCMYLLYLPILLYI